MSISNKNYRQFTPPPPYNLLNICLLQRFSSIYDTLKQIALYVHSLGCRGNFAGEPFT